MKFRLAKGRVAKEQPSKGPATAEQLAVDLDVLDRRFVRGDVRPKDYARRHAELIEELGRTKVRPLLQRGETILAEHYVVQGHFKLTQSVMKEMAQDAAGFLATDRRLFRWSFQDKPSPQAALLPDFEEKLEYRWYADLDALQRRREMRWGEVLTGLAILAAAALLWPLLEVIGPVLALTGLGGILHALLWPTRWVALIDGGGPENAWRVDAPGKPSGRQCLGVVAQGMAAPHVGPRAVLDGEGAPGG